MKISRKVYEELCKITKKHKPNECCCILFKDNSVIEDVTMYAASLSPGHFGPIKEEVIATLIDKHGIPSSIFHSHPCDAFISSTDIIYMYPTVVLWKCIWLVMSDRYELKAFTLTGSKHGIEKRGSTYRPTEVECIISDDPEESFFLKMYKLQKWLNDSLKEDKND